MGGKMKLRQIVIILGVIILLSSCSVLRPKFINGGYSYSTRINNYWNDWRKINYLSNLNRIEFYELGNAGYFILYNRNMHPSEYSIRVVYNRETEKKSGKWYEYYGWVEYYVEKASDKFHFDRWSEQWPHNAYNGNGYKKESDATIKINVKANKAHNGATFNIFFEGNAIAISGL